jgi:hypothetical protein
MTTAAGGTLLDGGTRRDEAAEMWRIAGQLEEDNPWWIVVFGVFTREFVAFPRFDATRGTIVTALYPAAMPPRMRAIEQHHAVPPPRPAPDGHETAPDPGDRNTVQLRQAS